MGERVVYPNQGVCRISGIELKEIGGVKGEFLTMKREEDGATVMIPRAKVAQIGLRHVAARSEVEEILAFLEADGEDPELDWKVRHRTHADKMVGGSLQGTAEVLKGLHTLALMRPLPQRERELYDSARHLLVHEVAVALGLSACSAEDSIDLALSPPAGSARAEAQAKRIAASMGDGLGLDELDGAGEEAAEGAEEPAEAEAEAPPARKAKKAEPRPPPKTAAKTRTAPKREKPEKAKAAKSKPVKAAKAKAKPAKKGRR
ncbi:MAG TPA: CarD family transcriptional regulator [Myxococcales bacterium]|nr:CarD family transcriptional regulator [Myxococcales bacterium]